MKYLWNIRFFRATKKNLKKKKKKKKHENGGIDLQIVIVFC
jgi:hypothetical protein